MQECSDFMKTTDPPELIDDRIDPLDFRAKDIEEVANVAS